MSKIFNPAPLQLSTLSLRKGLIRSVEDVVEQVKVANFDTHVGYLEVLKLLEPIIPNPGYLRMDIPGTNLTICETDVYFSAGVSHGQLVNLKSWKLKNEASFEELKQELMQGRLLVDNAKKVGQFTVLLTKDQVPQLKLERNVLAYWNALVAEHANEVIQSCTPWETRSVVKKFSRFVDPDAYVEIPGETPDDTPTYKYHAEILEEVLDQHLETLIKQIVSYVCTDTLAYMVASPSNRGIQITNYGNALALMYARDLEAEILRERCAAE